MACVGHCAEDESYSGIAWVCSGCMSVSSSKEDSGWEMSICGLRNKGEWVSAREWQIFKGLRWVFEGSDSNNSTLSDNPRLEMDRSGKRTERSFNDQSIHPAASRSDSRQPGMHPDIFECAFSWLDGIDVIGEETTSWTRHTLSHFRTLGRMSRRFSPYNSKREPEDRTDAQHESVEKFLSLAPSTGKHSIPRLWLNEWWPSRRWTSHSFPGLRLSCDSERDLKSNGKEIWKRHGAACFAIGGMAAATDRFRAMALGCPSIEEIIGHSEWRNITKFQTTSTPSRPPTTLAEAQMILWLFLWFYSAGILYKQLENKPASRVNSYVALGVGTAILSGLIQGVSPHEYVLLKLPLHIGIALVCSWVCAILADIVQRKPPREKGTVCRGQNAEKDPYSLASGGTKNVSSEKQLVTYRETLM